ncbi:MAG: hypothetical protein NC124_02470 [Clostridium sp.]|nr:hypothetical protein [Clostridium sp.]
MEINATSKFDKDDMVYYTKQQNGKLTLLLTKAKVIKVNFIDNTKFTYLLSIEGMDKSLWANEDDLYATKQDFIDAISEVIPE